MQSIPVEEEDASAQNAVQHREDGVEGHVLRWLGKGTSTYDDHKIVGMTPPSPYLTQLSI